MSYNVPATVKKHSDGYEEFFTSPGLVCLVEAFLQFFNDMRGHSKSGQPKRCQENASMEVKKQH